MLRRQGGSSVYAAHRLRRQALPAFTADGRPRTRSPSRPRARASTGRRRRGNAHRRGTTTGDPWQETDGRRREEGGKRTGVAMVMLRRWGCSGESGVSSCCHRDAQCMSSNAQWKWGGSDTAAHYCAAK